MTVQLYSFLFLSAFTACIVGWQARSARFALAVVAMGAALLVVISRTSAQVSAMTWLTPVATGGIVAGAFVALLLLLRAEPGILPRISAALVTTGVAHALFIRMALANL